jgi:hypothetical protein
MRKMGVAAALGSLVLAGCSTADMAMLNVGLQEANGTYWPDQSQSNPLECASGNGYIMEYSGVSGGQGFVYFASYAGEYAEITVTYDDGDVYEAGHFLRRDLVHDVQPSRLFLEFFLGLLRRTSPHAVRKRPQAATAAAAQIRRDRSVRRSREVDCVCHQNLGRWPCSRVQIDLSGVQVSRPHATPLPRSEMSAGRAPPLFDRRGRPSGTPDGLRFLACGSGSH